MILIYNTGFLVINISFFLEKCHENQLSESIGNCGDTNEFFDSFLKKMLNLKVNECQLNSIFNLSIELIQHVTHLHMNIIRNSTLGPYVLREVEYIEADISRRLCAMNSNYKRKKYLQKDALYVKPKSCAIGVRWDGNLKTFVQCTFEYVSIQKTIESLFKQREFRELYFSYNSAKKYTDGVYENFESGMLAKSNPLLTSEPYTIQLQLYTDDIEINQALQPSAGLHKVKAVYLRIVNLPPEYSTRLDNIYIVAVCNSNDVKELGFNHILEPITNEIKTLEINGTDLGEGLRLKCILTSFTFDNLGGNECFGLQMNFSQGSFCRVCTISKKDSEYLTKNDPSLWRTKEEYNSFIVEGVENLVPKDSKGYTHYSKLNNCAHFHTVVNHAVDPMHDLLEGIGIILLNNVINYCISHKIITENVLLGRITSFNYGWLNKKNQPSTIKLSKAKLGLTASKTYCLLVFLPFILSDLKHLLTNIWICVSSLLQLMQIVFSRKIEESDISRLEMLITQHLDNMMQVFNLKLTPKQHILTHYPEIIRMMGPVVHMSTMRYESKHTELKAIATKTKNFKNINFTIAHKCQGIMVARGFTYSDTVDTSLKKSLSDHIKSKVALNEADYIDVIKPIYERRFRNIADLKIITFFTFNGIYYRTGLVFLKSNYYHKIIEIVTDKKQFWFLAKPFKSIKYDNFHNSIIIEPDNEMQPELICLGELSNKNSYEIINVGDQLHIPAVTLETMIEYTTTA